MGLTLLLGNKGCNEVRDQDAAVGAADGGDGEEAGRGGGSAGRSTEAGSGGRPVAGKGGAVGGGGGGKAGQGGSPAGAGTGAAGKGGAGSSASGAGGGGAAGTAGSAGATAGTGGAAAGSGGASGGKRCGTRGGVQCGSAQFCNHEPDAECGATDRGGVCEDKPQVCTAIYQPVCGCDNRTYSSDCSAHGAGVSVKRDGLCNPDECEAAGGKAVYSNGATIPECESSEDGWNISGGREQVICCKPRAGGGGQTCGGIAALECSGDREFCNYEASAGGQGCDGTISDAAGVCRTMPQECPVGEPPACGCDRKSYPSACNANYAGVSVLHAGYCTVTDCTYLGGRVAYGLGPGPKCNAGETEHGAVIEDNGSIPIEGALCCLK